MLPAGADSPRLCFGCGDPLVDAIARSHGAESAGGSSAVWEAPLPKAQRPLEDSPVVPPVAASYPSGGSEDGLPEADALAVAAHSGAVTGFANPRAGLVPACVPCMTGGHFPGCRPLRSQGFWNPCCPCLFGSLGDGVLTHVLSFLAPSEIANAAQVCRRFMWASSNSTLWRSATIVVTRRGIISVAMDDGRKQRRLPSGSSAVLSRSNSEDSIEWVSSPLAMLSPSTLASSEQGASSVSPAGLARLIRQRGPVVRRFQARGLEPAVWTSLEEALLSVSSFRERDLTGSKNLPSPAIVSLACKNPRVSSLLLSGCVQLTNDALATVLDRCRLVRNLSLARCRLLGPEALASVASTVGHRVEALDLSGIGSLHARDVVTHLLAEPRPSLRQLRLRGIRGLTDDSIKTIAAMCPRLEVLDVGASDATGMLSALTVTDLSPAALEALAEAPCSDTLKCVMMDGRAGVLGSLDCGGRVASCLGKLPELVHLSVQVDPAAIGRVLSRRHPGVWPDSAAYAAFYSGVVVSLPSLKE
jgi:hypothetical protein